MQLVPYDKIIERLERMRIKFEDGLSDEEVDKIESFYQIKFPEVLKEFYQLKLPVSGGFYNYRDFSQENVKKIKEALAWPVEGMLFDIKHNQFWREEWGPRPRLFWSAKRVCRRNMKNVPILIPIIGHRYMPYVPGMENPPALSVYQTDIVYYGSNLSEFIRTEFSFGYEEDIDMESIQSIPFWTQIIMEPYEETEE